MVWGKFISPTFNVLIQHCLVLDEIPHCFATLNNIPPYYTHLIIKPFWI
jgi:hypothetical protein